MGSFIVRLLYRDPDHGPHKVLSFNAAVRENKNKNRLKSYYKAAKTLVL